MVETKSKTVKKKKKKKTVVIVGFTLFSDAKGTRSILLVYHAALQL